MSGISVIYPTGLDKKIKTHHIADLFAIKEGAAQLTGIYDAVTLSA
jgi:hypothetical protein